MNRLRLRLLAVAIFALPLSGWSAGLPPWEFGMSREQVKSFKRFGPYKTFSNGDLETHKGIYRGRKENVQFFFGRRGLDRIGIYTFEGKDLKKATAELARVHRMLQQQYGEVFAPNMHVVPESEPFTIDTTAIALASHAMVTGRATIMPRRQPRDMKVSASILSARAPQGQVYAVAIFFDPPR